MAGVHAYFFGYVMYHSMNSFVKCSSMHLTAILPATCQKDVPYIVNAVTTVELLDALMSVGVTCHHSHF